MNLEDVYAIYHDSNGVSTDTRADLTNRLFFCLKGPNFDANKFASEALEKGAALVVSDDPQNSSLPNTVVVDDCLEELQNLAHYHRKKFTFPVFGLTGSNGKTTNKELIHAVLQKKYRTFATRGNLNNHIGVPLTLLEIPLDAEFAIIEMGANHQGEIRELSNICDPDYGMITNIGKAHLEGFGGIDGVKKGKKELFDHIRAKQAKLFVNGDDHTLMEISEGINRTLFGTDPDFFVCGKLIQSTPTVSFSYQQDNHDSGEITTNLAGDYNFYNLLAAVCLGLYFEVPHDQIKEGLMEYIPTNNRSQIQKTNSNTLIIDAYNANPTSMRAALENLAKMKGQKLAILGHMLELGEESQKEHQDIIDLLQELDLDALLVGEYFKDCKSPFSLFNSSEELCENLKLNPVNQKVILIKGSRSVKMEKVLPSL